MPTQSSVSHLEHTMALAPTLESEADDQSMDDVQDKEKGNACEVQPSLPSLTLSPTDLGHNPLNWSSPPIDIHSASYISTTMPSTSPDHSPPIGTVSTPVIDSDSGTSTPNPVLVKTKDRSYSCSAPLTPFGIAVAPSTNAANPIPVPVKLDRRNYFEELLPRKLQLNVLLSLITLHEDQLTKDKLEGLWNFSKASTSRNKWVGKDKGVREIIKLSRVSKSWHLLVFDGQLWENLDLRAFPRLSPRVLQRLTTVSGPFVTTLDFSGHVHLTPAIFLSISSNLCISQQSMSPPRTQLTSISLRGCTALDSNALHHILICSPALQHLYVAGLLAVINTTCDIIAAHCPFLVSLDASRCRNLDASGLLSWASTVLARGEHLHLRELRISGLKYVTDRMMAALGRASPFLEVLDLSHSRGLQNSGIDAFVAYQDDDDEEHLDMSTAPPSARRAGRHPGDSGGYRRRVTRLRHISLSNSNLLTDMACSDLAHAVPLLEFLELAGLEHNLKDDGLIRLLKTTRNIRRLDLEGAVEITDSVLAALTPSAPGDTEMDMGSGDVPETGHALEHLVISYASKLTEDAMSLLIRNCTKLKVLEADNTRMGVSVVNEFVSISRQRDAVNAKLVAVDCRGINEALVKQLSGQTRPRAGWRAYDARNLKFLDIRDGELEDLKIGQDECDERRVVLKSFYSWQTVDAVIAAGEKRRTKWWYPSGRSSGRNRLLKIVHLLTIGVPILHLIFLILYFADMIYIPWIRDSLYLSRSATAVTSELLPYHLSLGTYERAE